MKNDSKIRINKELHEKLNDELFFEIVIVVSPFSLKPSYLPIISSSQKFLKYDSITSKFSLNI